MRSGGVLSNSFVVISGWRWRHCSALRVPEVAALQIPDVQVSARRGLLIIRRGKGLKHREIPLVQEARQPLDTYFNHRQYLAERWREQARVRGEAVASWSTWPDGHLFLGQRGPLTERGI